MFRKNIQDTILSAETEAFFGYGFHRGDCEEYYILEYGFLVLVDIFRQQVETYSFTVVLLLCE